MFVVVDMCSRCVQHYIELSSHYQRPRPPATVTAGDHDERSRPRDEQSRPCARSSRRPTSAHVLRQQSAESGVFMSRQASSEIDPPSPDRYYAKSDKLQFCH